MRAKLALGRTIGAALLGIELELFKYSEGVKDTYLYGNYMLSSREKAGDGSGWKVFLQTNLAWKYGVCYEEITKGPYDVEVLGVTTQTASSKTISPGVYMISPVGQASELLLSVRKPSIAGSTSSYSLYMAEIALKIAY